MAFTPNQIGGNVSNLPPGNLHNPQQGSGPPSTGLFAAAPGLTTQPVPNTAANTAINTSNTTTTTATIAGATAAAILLMYHPDAPPHLAHHYSLAPLSPAQKLLSLSKPLSPGNAQNAATQTFYRFPFLPNEIQDLVFQHALHGPPMMHYFKLVVGDGHMARPPNQNSTRYQWNAIARVSPVAAKTVQLARKRYMARATAEFRHVAKFRFDPLADLVAVAVTSRDEGAWLDSFMNPVWEPNPDTFHLSIPAKGIKRVGVIYEEGKLPCIGHESDTISPTRREIDEILAQRAVQAQHQSQSQDHAPPALPPQTHLQNGPIAQQTHQISQPGHYVAPPPDPWMMRRFRNTPVRCKGPCKTAMCKLVQWFRDADVIYIMVRLTQNSLRSSDMKLRLVSEWIEDDRKGTITCSLSIPRLYPPPYPRGAPCSPCLLLTVANKRHSPEPRHLPRHPHHLARGNPRPRHRHPNRKGPRSLEAGRLPHRVRRQALLHAGAERGEPADAVRGSGHHAPHEAQGQANGALIGWPPWEA